MQDVRLGPNTGLGYVPNGQNDIRLYPDGFLRGVSYLAPPFPKRQVGILVNTWAELPPFACFPMRARNTATFAADGTFSQESWSLAQEPRRYVSAKTQLDVINPSGSVAWTAAAPSSPSAWFISEHRHAVDNNEGPFLLRGAGKYVAEGRPWHGYFDILRALEWPDTANWINYDVSETRRHVIAVGDLTNNVSVSVSQNSLSLDFVNVPSGIVATAGCVRWLVKREIGLWTAESGTIKQRISADEGATFGMATTIGAGTQVTTIVTPQRLRYIYRASGGVVIVQIRDSANALIKADTTVLASGVDDKPIDGEYRPLANGKFGFVLWTIESGSLIERYSEDGIVFT